MVFGPHINLSMSAEYLSFSSFMVTVDFLVGRLLSAAMREEDCVSWFASLVVAMAVGLVVCLRLSKTCCA